MDRRDFLRSTGGLAAVAAGCAVATPAGAEPPMAACEGQHPRTLSFVHPWAESHAGLADDALRIAHRVQAALNAVGARDVQCELHAMATASADFTIAPVASDTARHPAFAYFGGLPGPHALTPSELEGWLATGGGQALWDDLAAEHGFKPLLAGHTGTNPVLWSKSPISNPEEVAGLKVVARGLDQDVIRALGAVPVTGDEASLESALSAHDTSAAVWGSHVHASAAGIPARFPHGLAGALGSSGSALVLKIDLAVWRNLSPAEQAAIEAATSAEFRAALADTEATRQAVQNAMSVRFGAKVETPAATFAAAVSRIAAAVIAHTAAHDSTASRIDRSYGAYLRAIRPGQVNVV